MADRSKKQNTVVVGRQEKCVRARGWRLEAINRSTLATPQELNNVLSSVCGAKRGGGVIGMHNEFKLAVSLNSLGSHFAIAVVAVIHWDLLRWCEYQLRQYLLHTDAGMRY